MTSLSVMVSLHAKRCFSDSGISRSSAKLEFDNAGIIPNDTIKANNIDL